MDGLRTFTRELAALAAIVAIAILTWHGDVSGDAAVAVLGAVVGGGVVSASNQRTAETTARSINEGTNG